MRLWRPVHGPPGSPSYRASVCQPCSGGGVSSRVMGSAWIAVEAANAMFLTVSRTWGVRGTCSPPTSRNTPHIHRGRSCAPWRTRAFTSPQSAAAIGCATPIVSSTAKYGVARRMSRVCPVSVRLTGRLSSGAGSSPTCPPTCGACRSTSIWWSLSGAARSLPGMWPSLKTPRSPPISWAVPACGNRSTAGAPSR